MTSRDDQATARLMAVISFMLFFVLIIALSPLLAYPMHLLLGTLADLAFHKTVKYVTLACALVFCGIYLHMHRMLSPVAFGFGAGQATFRRDLISGVAVGTMLLTVLVILFLALDIWVIKTNLAPFWDDFWIIILKATATGMIVALLEESIFRGALFSVLHRRVNAFYAILLTSLAYATVHFLAYNELSDEVAISWLTGIFMVPDLFIGLFGTIQLDHFLALFALGVLLSLMRFKTGNIALCVGTHAGLVATLKVVKKFSHYTPDSTFDVLVSKSSDMLGLLAFAWLAFSAFGYWYLALKPRHSPGNR